MAVQFGTFVPQGWKMDLVGIPDPADQYEAMSRAARVAEQAGFDSVWVYDHFHTVPTPTQETTFESWTSTAGLVRDTQRVRVGQMVTCTGYRNPALLAKMASTVDAMSHGRLITGIGAGWYEDEWRAYGYGFPDVPTRMRMFRDACAVLHAMWTEPRAEYDGQYYQVKDAINCPKGAGGHAPTMWIGGGGEQVTLKLVAQYADGCNFGGGNPDTIRHKVEVLHGHCAKLGRDPATITVSTSLEDVHLLAPGEDPARAYEASRGQYTREQYERRYKVLTADALTERIQGIVDAGAPYVILYFANLAHDTAMLERFAQDVMPRFA